MHTDKSRFSAASLPTTGWWLAASARKVEQLGTPENRIFAALSRLETIRAENPIFSCEAEAEILDTGDQALLGVARRLNGEKMIGVFNFSNENKTADGLDDQELYQDMLTGKEVRMSGLKVPAQGFFWLQQMA